MNIKLISVGKIKETYFTQAIKEYEKRLGAYCKLQMIEVKDEPTTDHAAHKAKQAEAERIMKHIDPKDYVIALAIEGKMLDSEGLAETIESIKTYHQGQLTLIIGGSLGIDDSILNRTNMKLSFSKMTFPHQLMKVILLEQLYRAFKINANEPYHK